MFRAEQQNQFIPSKSIAIKPENVAHVSPDDEIRFHIPSFVGFVDPTNTYLKFTMKFQNMRGQIVPDARAGGAHALFRQLIIRDGGNQATLEMCEEYGAYKALLNQFTRNVKRMDELFNGVQEVEGTNPGDKTLFYKALAEVTSTDPAAPDAPVREAHDVMIQMPLHCGLFKSGNVIPVSAMNGLRLQMQTDSLVRSCVLPDIFGSKKAGEDGLGHVELTTNGKTAGTEVRTTEVLADGGNFDTGYVAITDLAYAKNPFVVDDILYAADDADGTNEEALGTILGFYRGGVGNNFLGINYNSNRLIAAGLAHDHAIGSHLYFKIADREKAGTFFTLADNIAVSDVQTGSYSAPTFQIRDLEMIVQSVTPPEAYTQGMLAAANSSSGISFDIMSYQLFRYNQANTTGLVQGQAPFTLTRAKALFAQPLGTASSRARSLGSHSLSGFTDNAQTYEWIHGTDHYPSRLVPLKRYNTRLAGNATQCEALHISELQKAIANVDERVLNLQKAADNFCVARSLSKYGQVMDISKESTSVRIDYEGGAEQKIIYMYGVGLRRIMISSAGVAAMF